jgi:hypothetical protein
VQPDPERPDPDGVDATVSRSTTATVDDPP